MSKIRRILNDLPRAERAVLPTFSVRIGAGGDANNLRLGRAPVGRARKTKNFLALPFKTAGGAEESHKKLQGNVLLSVLGLQT